MTVEKYIQERLPIPSKSIENTLQLLAEDCTIPFIARYRKDKTGNLDEVAIEQIFKLNKSFDEIIKRKESILKSIEEQNALTPELQQKITQSFDLQELEDLYLPYKKRKKTKADSAREKGLEPLAKIIMSQKSDDVEYLASKYLNKDVADEDAVVVVMGGITAICDPDMVVISHCAALKAARECAQQRAIRPINAATAVPDVATTVDAQSVAGASDAMPIATARACQRVLGIPAQQPPSPG